MSDVASNAPSILSDELFVDPSATSYAGKAVRTIKIGKGVVTFRESGKPDPCGWGTN
jgi:hypothetical protein